MSNTDETDHVKSKTFHENEIVPVEKSTGDSHEKTSNVASIQHSVDDVSNDAGTPSKAATVKGWVRFEDEDNKKSQTDNIPQMENVDLSDKVIQGFAF